MSPARLLGCAFCRRENVTVLESSARVNFCSGCASLVRPSVIKPRSTMTCSGKSISSDCHSSSVEFDKVKDFETPPPIEIQLEARKGQTGEAGSLVITRAPESSESSPERRPERYTALRLLSDLDESFDEDGASATKWQTVAECSDAQFYRFVKSLQEKHYVKKRKEGRYSIYSLTEEGLEALPKTLISRALL